MKHSQEFMEAKAKAWSEYKRATAIWAAYWADGLIAQQEYDAAFDRYYYVYAMKVGEAWDNFERNGFNSPALFNGGNKK